MSTADLGLGILIGVEDAFSDRARVIGSNLRNVKQEAEGTVGSMDKLSSAIKGAAGAAIFVKAKQALVGLVTPAVEFEKTMAMVRSKITDNTVAVDQVGSKIKKLSSTFGKDANVLGRDLASVIGSGVGTTAESFEVLNHAVMLAKKNFTETAPAVTTLTNTMLAFKIPASQVAMAANAINAGANAGNLSMEELNAVIERSGAALSNIGGTFPEFIAMISNLAEQGIKGRQALTPINVAMDVLLNHQKDLGKLAKKGGFKDLTDMIDQLGLLGTLNAVIQSTKGNAKALQELGLSGTDLNALLPLLGDNIEKVARKTQNLRDNSGDLAASFQKDGGTMKESWEKLTQTVNNAKLSVGAELLTALKPLFPVINSFATALADLVQNNPHVRKALGFLALGLTAIGGALGGLASLSGFLGVLGAKIVVIAGVIGVGLLWMAGLFYAAQVAGQKMAEGILWFFSPLIEGIKGIPALIAPIGDAFAAAFKFAIDWVKTAIAWLDNLRQKAGDVVGSIPFIGGALKVATGLDRPLPGAPAAPASAAPTGAWAGISKQSQANADLSASRAAAPVGTQKQAINITVPQSKIEPVDVQIDRKNIASIFFDMQQQSVVRATG